MKKYLIQVSLFLLVAAPWACIGAAVILHSDNFASGCAIATLCVIFGALSYEALRK